VSTQGYEEELRSERSYVAGLYTRLDAERARVKGEYNAALRGPVSQKSGGTPMERDVEVRALAREVKRLDVADAGLCFGRLDTLSGERSYIGRIGLLDEEHEYEPVLLDWRAPASRAFYVATAATPENMRRRRQFHTRGRHVVDFTDEVLGRPGGAERGGRGDSALLAAVNAPHGDGMRDIVATIQAEQDEIIRLDHPGVLVIEGGPGTGKTVVALHRVAYLLYTQRERMERHGMLVVGPNPAFLNHIGRVLPSLGESAVVFMTTGDLVPGLRVTAEDTPEVARLKGSLKVLDVLAAAVADRQRLPGASAADRTVRRPGADRRRDRGVGQGDHLFATDLLYAEDLADRFVERDTRDLAERAAADRDWTYRHVVVDEAQELSEMDWRVLMRRCPGRSFTVVGDLAQRRSVAGATSWDTMLEPYVPGRWIYRSLSVNYRTPAEIMTVAAALLAEFAPGVQPPESVRACGVAPWPRRVTEDELPAAIEEFVRDEAGREGTGVVIGPPGVPGAVVAVPPSETKGLEFDAVLVVEPMRSSPTAPAAPPSSTSPSPAPPNASASCTRAHCRRP
jgi:DNA helicase IV